MRVIASVDLEGVAGVVHEDQTDSKHPLAGRFGVPVRLVRGGQSISAEATALLGPDLMTLAVKEAVSRFASRGLPIVRARG